MESALSNLVFDTTKISSTATSGKSTYRRVHLCCSNRLHLVTVHALYLYSYKLLQFTLAYKFVALITLKKFCRKYIIRICLYDNLQNIAFWPLVSPKTLPGGKGIENSGW